MKIYSNLTQCLISHRLVYLRSTDVEQLNYHRLLWSVPDEWFYFLHLGEEIIIIDKSKHKRGKIERIFIPVLVDLLNYLYFKKNPKNRYLIQHFNKALEILNTERDLYTRYLFWKNRIKEVKIRAITMQVKKEPNLIHKKIL